MVKTQVFPKDLNAKYLTYYPSNEENVAIEFDVTKIVKHNEYCHARRSDGRG